MYYQYNLEHCFIQWLTTKLYNGTLRTDFFYQS
jgi:hypothetical protein